MFRRCDDLVLEVDLISLTEAVELIVDHVHGAVKAAPTNVQKYHAGRLHFLLIIDGEERQVRSFLGSDVDFAPKTERIHLFGAVRSGARKVVVAVTITELKTTHSATISHNKIPRNEPTRFTEGFFSGSGSATDRASPHAATTARADLTGFGSEAAPLLASFSSVGRSILRLRPEPDTDSRSFFPSDLDLTIVLALVAFSSGVGGTILDA